MKYLVIEYQSESKSLSIVDKIREVLEKEFESTRIEFIGSYPNREAVQLCSILRERI